MHESDVTYIVLVPGFINFKHIAHIFLVFVLSILTIEMLAGERLGESPGWAGKVINFPVNKISCFTPGLLLKLC